MSRTTGLTAAATLAVAGAALLAAPTHASAATPTWHRYVLAPKSAKVAPVRVVSTAGSVEQANRLTKPGTGATTLTMTPGGPQPVIVLDYGKNVGGIPFLDVEAVTGTPTIRASFSEAGRYVDEDGDNGGFGPCCGLAPPAAEARRFNDFAPSGARVLRTTFQQGAERYERIALTTPGQIRLRGAGIDFKAFRAPARRYQGWFESSDRTVNRVWYAAAYTDQLDMVPVGSQNGNTTPRVVDGAKRDRNQWSGDILASGPSIWNSLGTAGAPYVRATLLDFVRRASSDGVLATTVPINAPGVLSYSPSYVLHALDAMVDYYRYSGDTRFAKTVLPAIRRQLQNTRATVGAQGLITSGGLDWDLYDGGKTGPLAAYNIIYFHALQQAAFLEAHVGDNGRAATLRRQAKTLRTAINATFLDDVDLYRVNSAGAGEAQDASVLAVLYGVAPARRASAVLQAVKRRLWTPVGARPFTSDTGYSTVLSPFINGLEVQARMATGDVHSGLQLLRRHFGRMVAPGPDTTSTLWEKMAADGSVAVLTGTDPIDNNSLAHGWSTSPLTALSQSVLGVSPVDPGYRTWTVTPNLGSLRWARGQVPTPSGPIKVRWRTGKHALTGSLKAPAGTRGNLVVANGTAVRLDGHRIPSGHPVRLTGGGRTHTISIGT